MCEELHIEHQLLHINLLSVILLLITLIDNSLLSGDNSDVAPPDPIPNSEVKHISGDGSLGFPHARVAHCQAPIQKKGHLFQVAFFCKY